MPAHASGARLPRLSAAALALSLGAAASLIPSESWAFCRTRTCNPVEADCIIDSNGCVTSGQFLHWSHACVSFSVDQAGSPQRGISFTVADDRISDALSKWIAADCGGGAHPSLKVRNFGPVACGTPVYDSKGPNANVWMFSDLEWGHLSDSHTLALTTVRYDPVGGEIYDVDVEVNSAQSLLTTSDTDVSADLDSIVTHEAGHFLGLSHSENPEATMWAGYQPRNISMRDLAPDDVSAICEAYPANRAVSSLSCEPRRGFTKMCKEDLSEAGGCSFAMNKAPLSSTRNRTPLSASFLSLAGVAFALWSRRSHRGVTNRN